MEKSITHNGGNGTIGNENALAESPPIFRQVSDSIKLIRNSRGYSWEIRITSLDVEALEVINQRLINKFGDQKDE